jgi:hypothetical protein
VPGLQPDDLAALAGPGPDALPAEIVGMVLDTIEALEAKLDGLAEAVTAKADA